MGLGAAGSSMLENPGAEAHGGCRYCGGFFSSYFPYHGSPAVPDPDDELSNCSMMSATCASAMPMPSRDEGRAVGRRRYPQSSPVALGSWGPSSSDFVSLSNFLPTSCQDLLFLHPTFTKMYW